MKIIRGCCNVTPVHQRAVLTIGNYDGVHLGHQKIITTVISEAHARGVPSMLMTFEPQPKELFMKADEVPARLMRLRGKCWELEKLGLDYVFVQRFDYNFAGMDAEQFIKDVLVGYLNISCVIVGKNFRFGAKRQGDTVTLEKFGHQYGFDVHTIAPLMLGDVRVSSTQIRQALEHDNLELAEQMLGRHYAMTGRVAHGKKLGRILGFPTANLNVHRKRVPVAGIFAVEVLGLNDKLYYGVANVGNRPTIEGGGRVLLEVHLFDFNQDIYGRYIRVEFVHRLRDEERYDSMEELTAQIYKDAENAREFFRIRGGV